MEEQIVWDGTGHWRDAQPVMEWLAANNVDGSAIPLNSVVKVRDGEIGFVRIVETLAGRVFATQNDEPAMVAATAPLLVAWPVEATA